MVSLRLLLHAYFVEPQFYGTNVLNRCITFSFAFQTPVECLGFEDRHPDQTMTERIPLGELSTHSSLVRPHPLSYDRSLK